MMLNFINKNIQETTLNFNSWPNFEDDEIQKVNEVLASGKINYWTGEEGKLFEKEFAELIGTKYAVALMNGTVALEAALMALDIGSGDEVITSCRTFIASASCVILRGAKPVLADVDPVSQNITAETILKVITPHTKAIIIVHLAGWPCDMDDIIELAKQHHLYLIEDCAQAPGAVYKNKKVGSFGDIAAFSFCQDKIITTGGEGGMVTTKHQHLWEKIWSFKDHGKNYETVYRSHPPGFRWLHETFGTNWRMTEMQAAIGRVQLKKLTSWIQKRQHYAHYLNKSFSSIPSLRLTIPPQHIEHVYYKYYVFVIPEKLKPDWHRERIMNEINQRGVPCFSGICGEIYREKAFLYQKLHTATCLTSKTLSDTSLMFLVHPTLTDKHMEYTVDVVKEIMEIATKS